MRLSGTQKHIFVKGNDVKSVSCIDNKGNIETIEVGNRTGVRIYQKNNSKKTFYFNTIILTDSTITGSNTHFFKDPIKPIPLDSISKIEILR